MSGRLPSRRERAGEWGMTLYPPHLTPFLFFMGDGERGSQPLKYTVLFAASCCFLPSVLLRHCLTERSASAETSNPDVPSSEQEAALGKEGAWQPTHLPASFSQHPLSPTFYLQILTQKDAPQPRTAAARLGDAHQGSTGPQVDGGSPALLLSSAQAQVRGPATI